MPGKMPLGILPGSFGSAAAPLEAPFVVLTTGSFFCVIGAPLTSDSRSPAAAGARAPAAPVLTGALLSVFRR